MFNKEDKVELKTDIETYGILKKHTIYRIYGFNKDKEYAKIGKDIEHSYWIITNKLKKVTI